MSRIRRLGILSRLGFLLAVLAPVVPAAAQTTNDVGGFNRQFWDMGDNAGSGAYIILGNDNMGNIVTILPDSDIFTFSTAQKDAIDRAFEYWGDVLNLGPATANSPTIRVVGQDINALNANALSFSDSLTMTNSPLSRIVDGANPTRLDNIDGRMVFFNTPFFTTGPITQYTGSGTLEAVAIHEMGHILGIAASSAVVPVDVNTIPTFEPNTPFSSMLDGPGPFANFQGTNATTVFGSDVPLGFQNSHFVIPFSVMTRGFFLTANGDIKDYRNNTTFTPVELAVMRDLGYNITLNEHFGSAFYQDGTGVQQSVAGVNTIIKDYGVGSYIQADNLNLLYDNNINADVTFGTGIRINGGQETVINTNFDFIKFGSTDGNLITIDSGTTVSANGFGGIGVLQAAGANNVIVHRGTINANGFGGRGIVFDFGSGNLIDQVTSDDYNLPMATRLDVTGIINTPGGNGNAIEIANSAAFGTINVMQGAQINGNIVNSARLMNLITGIPYDRPTITFGYTPDAGGQVTLTPDPAFNFIFDNNIAGTTRFDADFAGGTTNLNGVSLFNDSDIRGGATLGTTGTVNTNTLDVMNGGTLVSNGLVNVFNMLTVGQNSRLEGNGTINSGNEVTINGTVAPGNSIGTLNFGNSQIYSPMSTLEIEVQPSAAPVPGTDNDLINVNGTATFEGGTVDVLGLPPNGSYTSGASYTYLQTTEGVIVAANPTFQENLVDFRLIPFFSPFEAGFLLAFEGSYAARAGTFNQRAVGEYLDVVILDGANANVQTLRNNLDLLELNELRDALDQLSGEIYGSTSLMQIQSANQMFNVLSDQVNHNQLCYPYCHEEFWYAGYAFGGDADDDGNAHDTHYDVIGALIGQSSCIAPQTIGGVYYDYEDQNLRATDVASQVKGYSHRLGAYARNQAGPLHTLASGFLGWYDMESIRNVRVNTISETNRADFDGFQSGLYYENGLTFSRGLVSTQPFFSLQYLYWNTDGFTETGGPVTALMVDDYDVDSFRTQLGGRVSMYTARNYLEVGLEGSWIHEAADTVANFPAALVSAPNPRYVARGIDLGSDFFNIGPTMLFRYGNANLFLEYQAYIGEQGALHAGQWGAELVW